MKHILCLCIVAIGLLGCQKADRLEPEMAEAILLRLDMLDSDLAIITLASPDHVALVKEIHAEAEKIRGQIDRGAGREEVATEVKNLELLLRELQQRSG